MEIEVKHAAQPASLASKIDRLFQALPAPDGREYSYGDVAAAINAKSGNLTISKTYIWQLRTGLKDNPRKKHLEALADFFGVPPAYFFDDEASARVDAELELLVALRDSSVRHIALRANGLSTESLRAIAEMIERVRALEGLPANEEANGAEGKPHPMPTRRRASVGGRNPASAGQRQAD